MPIPLLVFAAAAGAGAVGTALAARRFRRPVKLVVLGQRAVGKTRLINSWRGDWSATSPTQAPEKITTISVKTGQKMLTFDKRFLFRKLSDVSGADEGMHSFRPDVSAASAVLYLLDARTLLHEETRAADRAHRADWVRVLEDGHRLKRHATRADRIVLVVTHTDLDPRRDALPSPGYRDLLTVQLAPVRASIGGPERVRVVAGSLADPSGAEALTDDVIRSLL